MISTSENAVILYSFLSLIFFLQMKNVLLYYFINFIKKIVTHYDLSKKGNSSSHDQCHQLDLKIEHNISINYIP